MIGFSSLSHAAGMACLTLAAESQLNNPSTKWQSSPNGPDSPMSDAQSEISSRAVHLGGLQASKVCVTRATVDSHLSQGQLEQMFPRAKQASECDGAGMLKATVRQFREIAAECYRYVLGKKSAPVTNGASLISKVSHGSRQT
jgi:hypothetical protein